MTEGNNEGKSEIQKFEYLENEKSFLDETRNATRCDNRDYLLHLSMER